MCTMGRMPRNTYNRCSTCSLSVATSRGWNLGREARGFTGVAEFDPDPVIEAEMWFYMTLRAVIEKNLQARENSMNRSSAS